MARLGRAEAGTGTVARGTAAGASAPSAPTGRPTDRATAGVGRHVISAAEPRDERPGAPSR
jgi:hypothetical protein